MGAFLSSMGFETGKWIWSVVNFAILISIPLIIFVGLRSLIQSNRRSQDMVDKQCDVMAKLEEIDERLRRLEERMEK